MKILFAIQGTGNGHLCRARDIYPELVKYGDVDVLISGTQADVDVPFQIKYKFHGLSFVFGKKGGIDFIKTAKQLKLFRLFKDIRNLKVKEYDLIINDFEPISAWACKLAGVPCVSLSHQCAVLSKNAPKPERRDIIAEFILRNYAPTTKSYGFHFQGYDDNIFMPIIRKEVRDIKPTDEGHYTVYLPSYDDETIVKYLSQFPETKWQVFSKHNRGAFVLGNVSVQKIENNAFIKSMSASTGVLCGAGFETPAEALFLCKKLLVIPMNNQYEQQCNAASLYKMNIPRLPSLNKKFNQFVYDWIKSKQRLSISYPDLTKEIVEMVVNQNTCM